jgi:hypothetical protein
MIIESEVMKLEIGENENSKSVIEIEEERKIMVV